MKKNKLLKLKIWKNKMKTYNAITKNKLKLIRKKIIVSRTLNK